MVDDIAKALSCLKSVVPLVMAPREAVGPKVMLVRVVGHYFALEGEECSGATNFPIYFGYYSNGNWLMLSSGI